MRLRAAATVLLFTLPLAAQPERPLSERLRETERRIEELKSEILRGMPRSPWEPMGGDGRIRFRSDLGARYELVAARFEIDGHAVLDYDADDVGRLDSFQVLDALLPPGAHTLTVDLQLRGADLPGFPYLRGYTFHVRSRRVFPVGEGGRITVDVVAFERGDVTTGFEEAPAIRFVER